MNDPSDPLPEDSAERLTSDESHELAEMVLELVAAQLPLSTGLQAAAKEASTPHLAGALRRMAREVEQGVAFAETWTRRDHAMPDPLAALLMAATRRDQLATALSELLEIDRTRHELRRGLTAACLYPLLIGLLSLVVVFVVARSALPPLLDLQRSFEEEGIVALPHLTQSLHWWSHEGWPWIAVLLGGLLLVAIVSRILLGPGRWRRAVYTVPLIGPALHWLAAAHWARLLAVFVEQDLPLPKALRLAGAGTRDAGMRDMASGMALAVERGELLSEFAARCPDVPRTTVALLQWGEATRQWVAALRTIHELLAERVRTRIMLLNSILPPVVLLAVLYVALLLDAAIRLPLLQVLRMFRYF